MCISKNVVKVEIYFTKSEIEVSVYLNQSEILAGNNSIFLQLPGESRDV
jgi:hypothetical protein